MVSYNDENVLRKRLEIAANSFFPYVKSVLKYSSQDAKAIEIEQDVARVRFANDGPVAVLPDIEGRKTCCTLSKADRMPSSTTRISGSKQAFVDVEDDEERLLWRSRRHDDAAVAIDRPTSRPMNRSQVKIPSGGPRPRNTLLDSFKSRGGQSYQGARSQLRGGDSHHLHVEVSRRDNVRQMPHAVSGEKAWPTSSPKRQKTKHQASSQSSSSFTDELLDEQNPETISFGPCKRSNQAAYTPSFNSQGSGHYTGAEGCLSMSDLKEHRNVEMMMSSTALTKKQRQKHHSRDQNHQPKVDLPVSVVSSSRSKPIDISGADDFATADPKPKPPYRGTARLPPSASNTTTAHLSRNSQGSTYGQKSPYFSTEPSIPIGRKDNIRSQQLVHSSVFDGHDEPPTRLNKQFVRTGPTQRSSEANVSSDIDELQLGTTVGKNLDINTLSSINRPRSVSPSKGSLSTLKSSVVEEDLDLEPSNIKPSTFGVAKPKDQSDLRFPGPAVREKKPPWAVDVIAVSLADRMVTSEGMGLVFDNQTGNFILKREGKQLTGLQILPHKLQKIQRESSGTKVRFSSSKTGNDDHILDIELRSEKALTDLLRKVTFQNGCKMVSESSEHMNKMFEKRRSEWQKSSATAQIKKLVPDDNQLSGGTSIQGEKHPRQPSGNGELKRPRAQRSVVEELHYRANENNISSFNSVPNGLPHEESVNEVLERLKPKHNQHLRRSTRTSSDHQKNHDVIFDDYNDVLKVNKFSKTHGLGEPWKKSLTYPTTGKKKITVDFNDLERLDEGEFLNDNLLSFYLRFLEHTLEEQRPELAKRVYFFNTYFFATLMNTHKGRKGFNYEGVQKWTRQVDLFTYDYIIVPINEATHWYLAIICNLPALDRSFSGCEDDQAEPAATGLGENRTKVPPSLNKSTLEDDTVSSNERGKDLDEREARNSFAEMSLDTDARSLSADDAEKAAGATTSIREDQEMLDIEPDRALPSSPNLEEIGEKAEIARRISEDLSEDPEQSSKMTVKVKKGKRKSGPPAVTRISPDKPVIITFDSLGMARSSTIRILKDYLCEEAKAKRGGMMFEPGEIKGITASHIPQQDNYYDCGVFLLGYVAKFLENDPKDFIAKIIRREYDEKKDWPNLKANILRSSIREQVLKLHQDRILKRYKEREAQENGEGEVKQGQERGSYPTPATPVTKAVHEESRHGSSEDLRQPLKVVSPAQPRTRREALESAMGFPKHSDNNDKETSGQETRCHGEVKATMQDSDGVAQQAETKPRPAENSVDQHDDLKEGAEPTFGEEPSVVIIESQSEQDASAPKSVHDARPIQPHSAVEEPHDLPEEIPDSQPSQTSKAFANLIRAASETQELPLSDRKSAPQETSVLLLEEPRQHKRKFTYHDNLAPEIDASHGIVDRDASLPNWGNQGNERHKRKRCSRKVQKSDEIVHIDD